MELRKKFMAVGAAAVLAIGGAGLYAGALATSSTGSAGAGSIELQSSCASTANIDPSEAVWVPADQEWKYLTATVTLNNGSTCEDQEASVNLYATFDGEELNTATVKVISETENTAGEFTVTFGVSTDENSVEPGINAALTAGSYNYGLVIQSPEEEEEAPPEGP